MDLRSLREDLEGLPSEPVAKSHPRNWIWRLKRTADFIGHARPSHAQFFRTFNPYPSPFQHVKFETEDGVTIAGWYGPVGDHVEAQGLSAKAKKAAGQARGGGTTDAAASPQPEGGGHASKSMDKESNEARKVPNRSDDAGTSGKDVASGQAPGPDTWDAPPFGLVLVPGMFSTKDDTIHKRRTIWVWRHWKVPVLCIDMRAFGESTGIATGAWKETYDVHAAARFLHEHAGIDKVGVIAESMGAAATLNALAHDAESGSDLMTAGALCWSAFVDMRDAVHYISTEPPRDDPFHTQWAAFRRLLSYKSHGGYERFDEYLDDAARVNGLSGFDEMADLANPKWRTSLIKAPTMLVHAINDPVVPVRHARRMERYAKGAHNIQVITQPFGGHTGFESMEPSWYWELTRRFFGEVNGVELPSPVA